MKTIQTKNKMRVIFFLVAVMLITPVMGAPTTSVHIVRYANDGVTILNQTTIDFQWMEENLPVYGDGVTHYYHQGPVFNASITDTWNPEENDPAILTKDYGAVKGTNVADLCNLVGGMSAADINVTLKASDGFSKAFAYSSVYTPSSQTGPVILTWYRADQGYVNQSYPSGMRNVMFADTSTNPWGNHVFGLWDMHESYPDSFWYYYQPGLPSTTGLSVQNIDRILIYSNDPAPEAPDAAFSVDVASGNAPLTVSFIDQSMGTPPLTYAWDFNNDGTTDSMEQNPTFTYLNPGTFSVRLTVSNEAGADTELKNAWITVLSPMNVTISVIPESATLMSGGTKEYQLIVDTFPAGLAGYIMTVNLSNAGIGEITSVNYPAWAFLNNTSGVPSDSIRMSAVDLNRLVQPGAFNVTLGTIIVRGDAPGLTGIILHVIQMDADGGDLIVPLVNNGELNVREPFPTPPLADFTATPRTGDAPLTVQFTDSSTGSPTTWAWDFTNDGVVDNTSRNPSYIYASSGAYSVNLTVTNAGGSDSELKTNYITVQNPPPAPPAADFSATPRSGDAPLTVQFTDSSAGSPTTWAWDFTNDGVVDNTSRNPCFIYTGSGTYSVNLTITNAGGRDNELKMNYITVTAPPTGTAVVTGWVASGSDYGILYVPGIRIRAATSVSDLGNPLKCWETTSNDKGIYELSGIPAGIPLYALALSPEDYPDLYFERPIQYQIEKGQLISCLDNISTPRISPLAPGQHIQVNWILKQKTYQVLIFL